MNTQHSGLDEEEVLLAFAVEPTHDRATLEHYLNQYPEHSQALVDCSIELMIDTTKSSDDIVISSEQVVEKAWQQFQSEIASEQNAVVENPFAKLNSTTFKATAKKLNVNNLLLMRLRDRAIDAATIPGRLIQRIAAELGATVEVVANYLQSPPTIATGQSFRSDVKPSVSDQISFEQAIQTSQLTAEQQETWKVLKD
jgi:hypothetical protein